MATSLEDFDCQDVRIAVVMNGGVSLAIWMSGVALELHHLVRASRAGSDHGWREYAAVLDLLHARARIDVIAGTSAGGINGGFLAVGLIGNRDLRGMRRLWRQLGGLEALLRDPLQRKPASLLSGDYFYQGLLGAYREIWRDGRLVGEEPVELILTGTLLDGRTSSFTDDMGTRITEVDYDATFRFGYDPVGAGGRPGGLGPHAGELTGDAAMLEALAAASRCTASFPGAFEPHRITFPERTPGPDGAAVAGPPGGATRLIDGGWPSSGGLASFWQPQHVVDGGILLNKPIRPALEAIYRQPASEQVRRVLAYVNPDPGELPEQAAGQPAGQPAGLASAPVGPPGAQEVLLGVLTRVQFTASVARELAEIRQTNEEVRLRRRARDRLAAAMVSAARRNGAARRPGAVQPGAVRPGPDGSLAEDAWPAYQELRRERAARTIGELLAQGQAPEGGRWSAQELTDAVRRRLQRDHPHFIPRAPIDDAVARAGTGWDWGQTTATRLADMTIDVLKRAIWLAPLSAHRSRTADDAGVDTAGGNAAGAEDAAGVDAAVRDPRAAEARKCIRDRRVAVHKLLTQVNADRRDLRNHWTGAAQDRGHPIPARLGADSQPARNLDQLGDWLGRVLRGWEANRLAERRERLYGHALGLAGELYAARDAIAWVCQNASKAVDPDGVELAQLEALNDCLLVGADGPQTVLRRMLRLDVVLLAFSGATGTVEQQVELVQVSSLRPELLTGIHAHHFGAFFRSSWRMNDWLRGRMDAAEQLMRILLAPERLRQLNFSPATALAAVRAIALGPDGSPERGYLQREWDRLGAEGDCEAELRFLDSREQLPGALPTCATWLARPLQTRILLEELPALAAAIGSEPDAPHASRHWRDLYRERGGPELTADAAWELYEEARHIGTQRIGHEVRGGSETFARTTSQAAAVLANTLAGATAGRGPKLVGTVLAALRGYALVVWAMVRFASAHTTFGTNLVNLAAAGGAALLAVSAVLPGVPVTLTLVGVLLVVAGASAAALLAPGRAPRTSKLRQREARALDASAAGAADRRRLWRIGLRLAVAAALTLAVLTALLLDGWTRTWGARLASEGMVRIGVAAGVILLGWWVARARPHPPAPDTQPQDVPAGTPDFAPQEEPAGGAAHRD